MFGCSDYVVCPTVGATEFREPFIQESYCFEIIFMGHFVVGHKLLLGESKGVIFSREPILPTVGVNGRDTSISRKDVVNSKGFWVRFEDKLLLTENVLVSFSVDDTRANRITVRDVVQYRIVTEMGGAIQMGKG